MNNLSPAAKDAFISSIFVNLKCFVFQENLYETILLSQQTNHKNDGKISFQVL